MPSPAPGPALAPTRTSGLLPTIGGSTFALVALFSMNLLNYVDRYTFFAVGKQVVESLRIGEIEYSILSVSFMVVYTLVSPFMGFLGDRYNRRGLLAFGVGLWSVATVATAFSRSFAEMFFWRALLGVGEATYGVIAPALLSDLFPTRLRGRVMGLYFLAIPLGGGLGYVIGGTMAESWHWRAAFLVVGVPGLLAALGALLISDPGRGASEGAPLIGKAFRPRPVDYLDLFRTPTFLFNTFGMAAVTFATGAYAAWGSYFYQTVRGMSVKDANLWIGGMTFLAGLLGIALGTWLADRIVRVTRRAYLLMAFAAVAIAVVPGMFGLIDPEPKSSLSLMFVAMILMAMVLGPCNAVTANVVPANRRATGYAVSIFLVHVFGDITSPVFIAGVAKLSAVPAVVDSPLRVLFDLLGARPVGGTNLTMGMLSVIPVLALGSMLFLLGSRHLPADQDRARRASGGEPGRPEFLH
jgi:MFS family permease